MAGHGLLFRACNLIGNYNKAVLTIRPTLLNLQQTAGLKKEVVDKLHDLNIPDKPKKPLSPYFRYISEQRSSLLKEHPDWKSTDVVKKCAADWKEINEEYKTKYKSAYKSELDEYTKKFAEYSNNLTEEQKGAIKEVAQEKRKDKKKRALKKELKLSGKPKRPLGSYMQFLIEQAKLKDLKFPAAITELKNEWGALSDEKKQKYVTLHNQDKLRYENEMRIWEQKMIKEGNEHLIRKISEKKSVINLKPLHKKEDTTTTSKLRTATKKISPQ